MTITILLYIAHFAKKKFSVTSSKKGQGNRYINKMAHKTVFMKEQTKVF